MGKIQRLKAKMAPVVNVWVRFGTSIVTYFYVLYIFSFL